MKTLAQTEQLLYPYQQAGVRWLRERERAILGDDPGLGKTAQALLAAEAPILVVAPKQALGVWREEAKTWLGINAATYTGSVPQRRRIREAIQVRGRPYLLITNYAMMPEVLEISPWWRTVIFDEAHILRNRQRRGGRYQGTLFPVARRFRSQRLYLLTGTPIIKGAMDLWTLLHMIDPRRFSSYWRFVERYCYVDDAYWGGGKSVWGTNKDTADELQELLADYLLRRTEAEVDLQLPERRRQQVSLDLTSDQRRYYTQIVDDLMVDAGPDTPLLLVTNKLVESLRLRQLLVHPGLIGLPGESAAMTALTEELRDSQEPVVIFCPFTAAFPLISAALASVGYRSFIVRGGMPAEMIASEVALFNRSEGPRALLATTTLSTSWSATSARIAYFLGFDWNPSTHFQAEKRIHRIGQSRNVLYRYLVHNHTIDQHVLRVLDQKVRWADLALDPKTLLSP